MNYQFVLAGLVFINRGLGSNPRAPQSRHGAQVPGPPPPWGSRGFLKIDALCRTQCQRGRADASKAFRLAPS